MSDDVKSAAENKEGVVQRANRDTVVGWAAIPDAVKIAGVLISVVVAFFAARVDLQKQISDLSGKLPLYQHAQKAFLFEQITNLALLENELSRIEDFVLQYRRPELLLAPLGSPQAAQVGMFAPPGMPAASIQTIQLVVGFQGDKTLEQLPVEAFTGVLLTQATRSLDDASLVTDLYRLHLAISAYNVLFLRPGVDRTAFISHPSYRARLQPGIPKADAENFISQADTQIDRIKQSVPSLKNRLKALRSRLERLIEQAK